MNRRDFCRQGLMAATVGLLSEALADEPKGKPRRVPKIGHDAPPRNRRPYANLDWSACTQIRTTSHGHCVNDRMLAEYKRHGFGLMTISNYRPSAPTCPGRELFGNWPENVLEAPNAEHHAFLHPGSGKSVRGLHMNGLGSVFCSSVCETLHTRNSGKVRCKKCDGSQLPWTEGIDGIIGGLVQPDGGGITVNHPTWTRLDRMLMLKMLDYDPRVLGCEVLNSGTNDERFWDWILASGRQCFGFFAPDWSAGKPGFRDFGANVLVVPKPTVEDCLRAYRLGNFYGSLHALGELAFTSLAFDGRRILAATDKPATFQLITARGVVDEKSGMTYEWCVPEDKGWGTGPALDVFARVRACAADGCGEVLFSQPFML